MIEIKKVDAIKRTPIEVERDGKCFCACANCGATITFRAHRLPLRCEACGTEIEWEEYRNEEE